MTLDLVVEGPSGLRDMRSELCELLRNNQVDGELIENVVLAASELATNGFRHGSADTVYVESTIEPHTISLVLRHSDLSRQSARRVVEPSANGRLPEGGRGLRIVDQICTWREVEVERGERLTRVSFARHCSEEPAPES